MLHGGSGGPCILHCRGSRRSGSRRSRIGVLGRFRFRVRGDHRVGHFPQSAVNGHGVLCGVGAVDVAGDLHVGIRAKGIQHARCCGGVGVVLALIAPDDGIGLALILVLGAIDHIISAGSTLCLLFVVAPDELGVALCIGGLGEVQALAVHHHIPQNNDLIAILSGLIGSVEFVSGLLQLFQHLADDLRVMGTVHIQHIVQCGGGHPHGEILFPGLLVQVREVGIGLAFIGKSIEVCVGIILGQQEIGQLVALLVHRPQGVVGAIIIGQRAAGHDEVLVFMLSVIRNRFNIYMRIVLETDIDIITIGIDTTILIFTVCGYNAVISNQRDPIVHHNTRRSNIW